MGMSIEQNTILFLTHIKSNHWVRKKFIGSLMCYCISLGMLLLLLLLLLLCLVECSSSGLDDFELVAVCLIGLILCYF